ncbi:hypothetical protein M7775_05515 [Sporomusa sphaeroides DSM 2875]|uniref:hypothetical protein n=1 Tax=Sporomusa sphaeroides TaxID=47679 RepID=UPI00202FBBA5|nr:hypothetical protein [Sporomusa sphaeroides]MCM0758033.1 hypothetical protein [Sporomusa sphaeroides DSM 2875]
MHVYFSCFTVYHLLITYILSITTYKNAVKHIIVSDKVNSMDNLIENIKDSRIWDEIIVIQEKSKSFIEIKQQVDQLSLNQMDILHFFSFGIHSSRVIFHNAPVKAKIILTEEGTMTCKPLGEYDKWHRILSETNGFNGVEARYQSIDWNRMDEVWLFEPRLFDQSLKRNVKKIDLTEWIQLLRNNKDLLQSFNQLFDYKPLQNDNRVIYFDSYFSAMRILPLEYEKFLLKYLVKRTKEYGCCIKPHPGESLDSRHMRHNGLDVGVWKDTNVPWEVIYLEYLLSEGDKPIVAITQASSSAYNTLLLAEQFGFKNCSVIILHELIRKYLSIDLLEDNASYTERAIGVYGADRVFVPKSLIELDEVLDKILPTEQGCEKVGNNILDTMRWFEGQYEKNCSFLPKTYVQSGITIDAGNGWDWENSLYPVSDAGQKNFMIEVKIDTACFPIVNKILWRPFFDRKYTCIKITKIQCSFNGKNFCDICTNQISHNGMLDALNVINFGIDEAILEFSVCKKIDKIVICGEACFADHHNKLVGQIHKLLEEKNHLQNTKTALIQELKILQSQNKNLSEELYNVYSLKSWRITTPLRWTIKVVKKTVKYLLSLR